MASDCI
ncbi:hypothetical protein Ctob_011347 [Chrysochromulina tobinii]|nr:hypothetical protein Ctob_011347 [Chrysochromulina tobinii]|eukprot:KOO53147.1 hypothetical protein Ctob_011347 [Chrysochromulina sp. CCMP291]